MKKRYHLVVFDWEGTLGDTLGHVFNTLKAQATHLSLGDVDESLARQCVALGLTKALYKLFPALSLHQHEQLLQAVQESLSKTLPEAYLFPGARACVEDLHQAGVALAIATNKGAQSLQRVLQESGLDGFFKVTRAAGQVPPKPCPKMIEEIMMECGVFPSETLMIGDSVSDMEMASNAGVDAIGFDFYHQQRAALLEAGAMTVFDDYTKLAHYLQYSND
jgi:phosphoglycolate phosphatase